MIDIIIPLHNSNLTIGRALESLVRQTYRDFCVTIIDDAGSENPLDIISSFQGKFLIHYHRLRKNLGVAAARQFGINQSKTEFICFLDADDTLSPQALQSLISKIGSSGGIGSIVRLCDEKGQFIELSKKEDFVLGKLFNRQFLMTNDIHFYTELRFGEDITFYRLACLYEDIVITDENVYEHWKNHNSLTSSGSFKKFDNYYLALGFLKVLSLRVFKGFKERVATIKPKR